MNGNATVATVNGPGSSTTPSEPIVVNSTAMVTGGATQLTIIARKGMGALCPAATTVIVITPNVYSCYPSLQQSRRALPRNVSVTVLQRAVACTPQQHLSPQSVCIDI